LPLAGLGYGEPLYVFLLGCRNLTQMTPHTEEQVVITTIADDLGRQSDPPLKAGFLLGFGCTCRAWP